MFSSIEKQDNFLRDFIEGEMYLQNQPKTTSGFIKFCEKMGINTDKDELEFFEKEKLFIPIFRVEKPIVETEMIIYKKEDDNEEYCKFAISGLEEGEIETGRIIKKSYFNCNFREDISGLSYNRKKLLSLLEEGYLFDPATREFESWDTFIGERLENGSEKIASFYSSFQIYWLEELKNLNTVRFNRTDLNIGDCKLTSEDGKIYLNATLNLKIKRYDKEVVSASCGKIYKPLEHENEIIDVFKSSFHYGMNRERLRKHYEDFNKMLRLILLIQSVYFPYARSGGGRIQVGSEKWEEIRSNFKLNDVLEKPYIEIKIEDVIRWYKQFSDKAMRDSIISNLPQLWKHMNWDEKDRLKGKTRLKIEYLQWAVMLKRVIEEYFQRSIFDIDEMGGFSDDRVVELVIKDQCENYIRKELYKDHYHDFHKRLYYLINEFGLNYQPKVMVFVEGETEETIFPEIFEKFLGISSEKLGLEFINFKGVDQLSSTSKTAEELRSLVTEIESEEKLKFISKTRKTKLNQIIRNLKKK